MPPPSRWPGWIFRPPVAAWLLLALALTAHLLFDLHVVLQDDTPAVNDRAGYIAHAVRFQTQARLAASGQDVSRIQHGPTFRPPLAPALGAAALALLGRHDDTPAAVGMLALLLCGVATLLLGRWLAGPGPGLVAALLLLAMPIVVGHSRVLMTDLLLTALVALSTLALWRATADPGAGRWRPGGWLWVGGLWGAGLLTKITFPLFVAGPLSLELILGWRRSRGRTLAGVGLAAGVAALLALPYYGPNLGAIIDFYQRTGHMSLSMEGMHALSQRSLLIHLGTLPSDQVGLALAGLGLAALVCLLARRPPGTLRLLVALLTPWLLFVPIPLRTVRNTMPALPFWALVLALAAASLPRARWRQAALVGLGLLAPLQFAALHYLPGGRWLYPTLAPPTSLQVELDRSVDLGILRPATLDWWARSLGRRVKSPAQGPAFVGLAGVEQQVGRHLRDAWALRTHRPELVQLPGDLVGPELERARRLARGLHYLVRVKRPAASSAPGEPGGGSNALVEALTLGPGFTRIEARPLPDGGVVELYARAD